MEQLASVHIQLYECDCVCSSEHVGESTVHMTVHLNLGQFVHMCVSVLEARSMTELNHTASSLVPPPALQLPPKDGQPITVIN